MRSLHEKCEGTWKQRVQVICKNGISEDDAVDIITKIGDLYDKDDTSIECMTALRNQEIATRLAKNAAAQARPAPMSPPGPPRVGTLAEMDGADILPTTPTEEPVILF